MTSSKKGEKKSKEEKKEVKKPVEQVSFNSDLRESLGLDK
jgi:hypothetical protein